MHHLKPLAAFLLVCVGFVSAQTLDDSAVQLQPALSVRRLIKFSGSIDNFPASSEPRTVEARFGLYNDQQGGDPVWQEVQNINVDTSGRYTVLLGLGTVDGLPLDVFVSQEA